MRKFEELPPSQKYAILALAAERSSGMRPVVFHYFGPKNLMAYVPPWRRRGPLAILAALERLQEEASQLEDAPPFFRRTQFISQIRSLGSFLKHDGRPSSGEELRAAVTAILGVVPPPPYDVKNLQKEIVPCAHQKSRSEGLARPSKRVTTRGVRKLIGILKGSVQRDILPHLFCGEDVRRLLGRSAISICQPKRNEPPCFYRYQGRGKAVFCLSGTRRFSDARVARTIMHELYPGHHLYSLYREMLMQKGFLQEDAAVELLYSSETPVTEGIAECASSFLESVDPVLLTQVKEQNTVETYLKKVLYNVWHGRYLERSMSHRSAVAYLRDRTVFTARETDTWLQFLDEWRLYYPCYPVGRDHVQRFLADNPQRRLQYLYIPKPLALLPPLAEFCNKLLGGRKEAA